MHNKSSNNSFNRSKAEQHKRTNLGHSDKQMAERKHPLQCLRYASESRYQLPDSQYI